ncbi:WecB/TagA/CpsF family glycosyltransferase [Sphingobium boeckii]|uniref:Exopolysaccharide biosynthesis WecB/TagA/CpsF family protein n=1 Tax=Sphingobium boeckii TaxID=1082345 RepID=A0A7W9EEX5_9SPHN|nr:WecB/TagA/CpsF family glycosyltransferase [Sphingobium boeckii]MBB5686627.1 exopolysaccharide biosynthesis WecB/TagA/CpsF family protein [Sphingobium boeckii]
MPIEHDATRPPIRFLDLDFSALSFDEVLADIRTRAASPRFSYIVTPNVDHVVKLKPSTPTKATDAFNAAYDAAALRLCDSRILRRLARSYRINLPLVAGSDLTAALFDEITAYERIAIIGGDATMLSQLRAAFPGPDYRQHIPPMGVLANDAAMDAIIAFIRSTRAPITLFAIGAPQSEICAHKCLLDGMSVGVGLCVGASIDFILGNRKRAPRWMQKTGLEWAFRLLAEPARLWRRYLIDGPRIFYLAAIWSRRNRTRADA